MLNEVFISNGQPQLTYANRDSIESEMKNAFFEGGQIINLIGASKIGKTVTARHLAKDNNYLIIHCGSIDSLDDFYNTIFEKFNIPTEVVNSDSIIENESISFGSKIFAKAQALLGIGAEIHSNATLSQSSNSTNSVKFTTASISSKLGDIFKNNKIILLLDDFHYLNKELQKKILLVLKGWSSSYNTIVLTSVTHRKGEIISLIPELRFRTSDIAVSNWTQDELENIIKKGETALNISIDDLLKKLILEASFNNPMLIQKICFELCLNKEILCTTSSLTKVTSTEDEFSTLLKKIADKMSYEELIQAYSQGKNSKGKERNIYVLKTNQQCDIYGAVMWALKQIISINGNTVDEITDFIFNNIAYIESNDNTKVIPNKSNIKISVTRTLKYINEIDNEYSLKNNLGLKYVDYKDVIKSIYILDPFFAFKIKYSS